MTNIDNLETGFTKKDYKQISQLLKTWVDDDITITPKIVEDNLSVRHTKQQGYNFNNAGFHGTDLECVSDEMVILKVNITPKLSKWVVMSVPSMGGLFSSDMQLIMYSFIKRGKVGLHSHNFNPDLFEGRGIIQYSNHVANCVAGYIS